MIKIKVAGEWMEAEEIKRDANPRFLRVDGVPVLKSDVCTLDDKPYVVEPAKPSIRHRKRRRAPRTHGQSV